MAKQPGKRRKPTAKAAKRTPAKAAAARVATKTATKVSKTKAPAAPQLAGRTLNTHPDPPDLRDRIYEPALLDLKIKMDAPDPADSPVLDQGREGACTGFALAAVVNLLNARRRASAALDLPQRVSPRMLYEMAKIHDEWPGETYDGSSVRGALKGLFHNGVCREELAPYRPGTRGWTLSVAQAKDARATGLGAYYRLRPEIIDYHAALNEAEVIVASARVHRGWQNPKDGVIARSEVHEGGHAFVIVGYDENGFLIQNSWGEGWGGFSGHPGIAHWAYKDWSRNIMDAWVLRLSVPMPTAFDLTHTKILYQGEMEGEAVEIPEPKRNEIIGHLIHIDDGKLVETGRYGTPMATIEETGRLLIADGQRPPEDGGPKYDHLMFYAHGGLNSVGGSARRTAKMKEVFKRNRIYPIHFMWESGFLEELGDVFKRVFAKSRGRVGGFTDFSDWMIENFARVPGRALWREMKRDADRAFARQAGGFAAVKVLLAANARRQMPLSVHLVGHSAGSIMHGELLVSLTAMGAAGGPVATCSLMAPACTVDFFRKAYEPRIGKADRGGLGKLVQYNLIKQRELDDTVGPYQKSLLYFISNAFEEKKQMPLLGMEVHADDLVLKPDHTLHYAGRAPAQTDSKSHGGFDNDRKTMNGILETMLGKKPSAADGFNEDDLIGY
jgi:hypothetical protein